MAAELEKIRLIAERVAEPMGLEVVDIELRGGAGRQGRLLRITIDRVMEAPAAQSGSFDSVGQKKPDLAQDPRSPLADNRMRANLRAQPYGVTHEDCANLSREVSTILDVEDAVEDGEYVLEVSSPGLDRKLSKPEDFRRFTGSRVKLMTHEPVGVTEKSKGNRHFEGRLESFENGTLTLDLTRASKKKQKQAGGVQRVEIALSNVERANLAPEI